MIFHHLKNPQTFSENSSCKLYIFGGKHVVVGLDTVDVSLNPAAIDMVGYPTIPLFAGFCRWCRISSINSNISFAASGVYFWVLGSTFAYVV